MNLALLELPPSEIAAVLAIAGVIGGGVSTLLLMWLSTKFVRKSAYYHDKDDAKNEKEQTDTEIAEVLKRVTAIEQAHELAKQPITTMQKAVEEMKNELNGLSKAIGGLKESVAGAISDLDKRAALLEASNRQKHQSHGRDRGGSGT